MIMWFLSFINLVYSVDWLEMLNCLSIPNYWESFSSVHFRSVTHLCPILCDPMKLQHARPPCPSPIPWVHSDSCPSSPWCHAANLILCSPFLLLPPIPPSIRVFSNESTLRMRWPKYWSFRFSISPSKEHPGLISFRMDWLDLQGTLQSLLQHHVQKHQFFGTQLSSQSNSHSHTWPLEKPYPWLDWPLLAK